jgi:hypothetical protein
MFPGFRQEPDIEANAGAGAGGQANKVALRIRDWQEAVHALATCS